jgi:DNA polymerase I
MAQVLYDKLGYERSTGCRMILQVHDELLFECPTEYVPYMKREIKELMEHPFFHDLAVRLEADGGSGLSWGAAKG